MKHVLALILCFSGVITSAGCTMCFTPYDDHYNGYGGVVERQNRVRGRVGSILSDPSLQYADSGNVNQEPTEADLYPLEQQQPNLESIAPPLPEELGELEGVPEGG